MKALPPAPSQLDLLPRTRDLARFEVGPSERREILRPLAEILPEFGMLRVRERRATQAQVAEHLGLTVRQVERLYRASTCMKPRMAPSRFATAATSSRQRPCARTAA